jgi:hypothetical protein
MNDDSNPMVAHGEQEDVMDDDVLETGMDELDRFMVYALGGLGPPLTKQDHVSPATLSPDDDVRPDTGNRTDELVRKILAQIEEESPPLLSAYQETCRRDRLHRHPPNSTS